MDLDSVLLPDSHFHNPRLNLNDKDKQQKIHDLTEDYVLTRAKLDKIMQLFTEQMLLGLMASPPRPSAFYMSNTFVTETNGIPTGTEEGDFVGLDLGGTNLRVYLVKLKPGTDPLFRTHYYDVPKKIRQRQSIKLFDFLAECLNDSIGKYPDLSGKRLPLGFTFCFGYEQLALDRGIIKIGSIATDFSDVHGQDAGQLLRDAIERKKVQVELMAILNDGTTTLVYGMYMKPYTQIGFIMGSGINTCYLEKVDRIEYMDPIGTFGEKVDRVILNAENGPFGDDGCIDFAKTKFDRELDDESLFRHQYGFEKLTGGALIGDLVRRTLLCLTQNNLFGKGVVTDAIQQKDVIMGQDVSAVESDSTDSSVVQLLNRLGYDSSQISGDDIQVVRYVCALISVRIALLVAADIAAVAKHIGDPLVRCAVDGSLYKKHPKMQTLINDFIGQLVPNQKVETFLADGGSGIGAAFVAAVVTKRRQQSAK